MYKNNSWADELLELSNINWEGKEEKREVCKNALEMLIGITIAGIFLLILGVVTNTLKEVFIYITVWTTLQIVSGGKIAKPLKDTILFIITAVFIIGFGKCIVQTEGIKIMIFLLMLIGLAINFMYAGKRENEHTFFNKRKIETLMVWVLEFIVLCNLLNTRSINSDSMYQLFVAAAAVCFESVFMLFRQMQLNREK